MRIIGLTGYARSGKDTVGSLIRQQAAAVGARVDLLSFAAPLKAFCAEVFGFSDDQLYGNGRDTPDSRWTRPDGTPLTARYALQTLGTEWGRNCDPEIWTKAGMRRAAKSFADLVVFTDVRFVNEAAAIRKAGGEIWRIARGAQAHNHPSEAAIWSPEMDLRITAEIHNTGSLADLAVLVKQALHYRESP